MKRTLLVILILILTTCFFGCSDIMNLFKSGDKGELEGSVLDWAIIPAAEDSEAMIDLALRLYENANRLDKEIECRKFSTYGVIEAGPKCERYIFNVKNGKDWYYSEAQHSENAFTNAVSPPFLTLKYANFDIGKAVTIHTEKGISVDKASGIPSANLSEVTTGEEAMPIFYKEQEGKYFQTDFVIERDTIKWATVEKNEEGEYFMVTINLDVENAKTTEKPLADLRENVSDANYTSCVEYIEIWYSGHYKFFNAVDHWKGTKVIPLNATIDYKTYFTYDKEECDISRYYGYSNLIELLNK